MSNWLDEATDIASQVARVVHRKYNTYFDVSDVRQELLVWILRRESKVRVWLDHNLTEEEYRGGVKQLGKTLSRQADKYCRKRKAQFLGYAVEDEAYYSPITLSELLPFVWADVVATADNTKPRVSGGGAPAEGGNYVVQLIDIRRAIAKLDEMDRDVLQLKFENQLTFSQLAEELQVSDTTAHRKVDGALRRLNNHLGGQSPFTAEIPEDHVEDVEEE
jgi:RNA polymerase sigma factor (sigma-70 family)